MFKRSGVSIPQHFPITSEMHATFEVHILRIRDGGIVVGDDGSNLVRGSEGMGVFRCPFS